MNRGLFSSSALNRVIQAADKEWVIGLDRFHRYWYDLVVNPHEVADYFNSRQLIVDYLRKVKAEVEAGLEKRFVYFICSRERVRFNTEKAPFYNPLTGSTKLHLLVGRKGEKRTVRHKFYDADSNRSYKPRIDISEKYITFLDIKGKMISASVHDFLADTSSRLGLDSRVEYVGYTKNPELRPTNGEHTGLSDTLHRLADDGRDSLIYFNLFQVVAYLSSDTLMLNFAMANSMTDEVGVDLEGRLLEKCFIFYFDADGQNRNKKKELAELKGMLRKISGEQKITRIRVHYEFLESNEYGVFSSSRIPASSQHIFTVQIIDDDVVIMNEREGRQSVIVVE